MTAEAPTPSREVVVIIRPSFMKFCQDACRAALFNHALYWIARKTKSASKEKIVNGEVYWYATSEEIVDDLAGSWGEKKVRSESNALVEMGLLGRAKNPKMGNDRTKHFFFGPEQCKKLLDLCIEHQIYLQQIDLSKDVLHLIDVLLQMVILPNANEANGKFTECIRQIYRMQNDHQARANGKFTGPLTQVITQESNTGKNAELPNTQSADADMHSSLTFSSEDEMVTYLKAKGMNVTLLTPMEIRDPVVPVPDAKQKETGKHPDSYSQQRQPEEEQSQGRVLPFASRSEQPTTAQQAKPEKPRRQKPVALVQMPESEKPTIVLGEREQAVYNEWAKMPWFKSIAPKITPTLAGHCATLASCETIPTTEIMLKTRHWRDQQHPEQKGRGYELGNFVHDYPKYLSSEYQSVSTAPPERKRNPLGISLNGIEKQLPKVASKRVAAT